MRTRWLLYLSMVGILLMALLYGMAPGALSRSGLNGAHLDRPNATFDVSIIDYQFQPASLTIHIGDTVTWTNNGAMQHTTTSDIGDLLVWNSSALLPGQTFSFTFTQVGVFPYHCAIHSSMHGTITVIDLSTPLPTNTPTATSTDTQIVGPTLTDTPTTTAEPSLTPTETETPTPTSTVNPNATNHVYLPPVMKSP